MFPKTCRNRFGGFYYYYMLYSLKHRFSSTSMNVACYSKKNVSYSNWAKSWIFVEYVVNGNFCQKLSSVSTWQTIYQSLILLCFSTGMSLFFFWLVTQCKKNIQLFLSHWTLPRFISIFQYFHGAKICQGWNYKPAALAKSSNLAKFHFPSMESFFKLSYV